MSVSIRQAVLEDAPTLAQMRWDDSTEDGTPATQPDAESDGRVVAHIYVQLVGMVPRPDRFARRWGCVAAVYTVPEARNRGIGSRLRRRVIDWAKEEELESLLLWPSDRSVPFYERTGFVRGPDALELHLDS